MAGDEPATPAEPPDVPNRKKEALEAAADQATSTTYLVEPGGELATRACGRAVTFAWESPWADDFCAALDSIGEAVRTGLQDAVSTLTDLASAQPAQVPHDDPRGQRANYPPPAAPTRHTGAFW